MASTFSFSSRASLTVEQIFGQFLSAVDIFKVYQSDRKLRDANQRGPHISCDRIRSTFSSSYSDLESQFLILIFKYQKYF